jgi:predicted extracellular nuclease
MPVPSRFVRPLALSLSLLLVAGCTTPPAPTADSVRIGTVQGSAERSALVGRTVVVEGTVVADFDGGPGSDGDLGGWFVQDAGDGDPATSDALLVLPATAATDLARGDAVRVRGEVVEVERGDGGPTTALRPLQIRPLAQAAKPAATELDAAPADWERLEAMQVRAGVPLQLVGQRDAGRLGAIDVVFGARPWQPTERARPGSDAARAIAADNARRRLRLDDGHLEAAPRARLPANLAAARLGSRLRAVEGVIEQRDGDTVLQLLSTPRLEPAPAPPTPTVGGDLRVAALNLENLFNGDGRGGGFPTERGARSAEEFARQLGKHVATLRALDADIVALMELENDGYGPRSSIATLVDALNADGAHWRFVDAGHGPGDDAIRVGLLYRGDRVRTEGAPATLTESPFGAGSRVPLAQAFVALGRAGRDDGPALLVVANHFKSKGCGGADGANAYQGDGAGCWDALRTDSARRLHAWLATDPTGTGTALAMIVGDLNSYAAEAPVRTLLEAGWRDAFAVAGVEAPYSYVYDGLLGRLDHALLSPALAARLRGAAEWHSNADAPYLAGYRGADPTADPTPWRSADHDPLLLGFDLRD